jgi:serine/threonine protein kinase/tetratricopeptide (TPR) repeat protein
MNEPHDPNRTVHVPSVPADSLDAGPTADFAGPRSSLGAMQADVLTGAEGESTRPDTEATAGNLPMVPGYRVLHEIARGGMGRVLAAFDFALDRDVAIKILLPGMQADRFVRESKITARLPHPGIPPVHALGTLADGSPFLAMKLIAGHTLAEEIKRGDRPRLLQAFLQVCQAVGFAHSKGILHRDLKPANVMVGAFGEVQVMDWGLAKEVRKDEGGRMKDEKEATDGSSSSFILHPSSLQADPSQTTDYRAVGESTDERTQVGQVLGTPTYMAPEQARGEATDARADVFALGGILCAILTGHPPFGGRTRLEVTRRAGEADLAEANARLDSCGADTELVALCRRCLSPSPADRPAEGQAVADALTAYLGGVQEKLRKAELERAAAEARAVEEAHTRQMAEAKAMEERRRRRATLALAAAVLALVVLSGGGAAWWWQHRTAIVRDVEAALDEVHGHVEGERWPEARASLERAEGRLGGSGPQTLQDRVQQMRTDVDMVAELEAIRLRPAETGKRTMGFDYSQAAVEYAAAFRKYGIDVDQMDASEAVARVQRSAIRELLLAGLADWKRSKPNAEQFKLQAIIEGADDNVWRQALRKAARAKDIDTLRTLAGQEEMLNQPPGVISLICLDLQEQGLLKEVITILAQTQRRVPGDFWINYQLGYILSWNVRPRQSEQAIAYFRAAVALRPKSAAAHSVLGAAMYEKGDLDGAIAACRQAIALDPNHVYAYDNLGKALLDKGHLDDAVAAFRQSLAIEPKDDRAHVGLGLVLIARKDPEGANAEFRNAIALNSRNVIAHANLGQVHKTMGHLNRAIDEYRKAIAIDPTDAGLHISLGHLLKDKGDSEGAIGEYQKALVIDPTTTRLGVAYCWELIQRGRLEEARTAWQKVLEQEPTDYDSWHNYAELCLFLGQEDAYRRTRTAQLERFGNTTNPVVADRLAKASLLLPGSPEELRQAAALADRALAAGPEYEWYAYFQLVKALAEYRQGRWDSSAELAKAAATRLPSHSAVTVPAQLLQAMVQYRKGQTTLAQKTLAGAVSAISGNEASAVSGDAWICHILRREAETLILPNLGPFLQGAYRPKDGDECLALSVAIRCRGAYLAGARAFAATFPADPKLADDLNSFLRYYAACLAARAGCGYDQEAHASDDRERARWRTQALDWLRADLAAWTKLADEPKEHDLIRQVLQHWQKDTDLASLRDAAALTKLPPEERAAYESLWADLAALLKKAKTPAVKDGK